MQELVDQAARSRKVVKITADCPWRDTLGVLEDTVPGTGWYNVRVRPDLRLALRLDEFTVLP